MDEGTRLRKTIWRFIKPSGEEMVLYSAIAAILFVLALYHTAISGQLTIDASELFSQLTMAATGSIDTITAAIGDSKLLLFGFWFIVGTAVYILLWFIANLLIDSYNNIVVSAAFVHPQSFHQSQFWAAIALRAVLRVSAALALIAYGYFWIKALLPAWDYAFKVSMSELSVGSVLNAFATGAGVILTLHICTILFRIAVLRRDD